MINDWKLWIVWALPWVIVLITWFRNRCKHKWELVDKTEFPSDLEVQKQACGSPYQYYNAGTLREASSRKIVLVLRCTGCGYAKIFKEKS